MQERVNAEIVFRESGEAVTREFAQGNIDGVGCGECLAQEAKFDEFVGKISRGIGEDVVEETPRNRIRGKTGSKV